MAPLHIAFFVIAIAGQVLASSLLPATKGFTALAATAICLASFTIAFFCLARLVHDGVNLSLVIPVMTCTVPLITLVVAVLIYGEAASTMRLSLLAGATLLIGYASTLR